MSEHSRPFGVVSDGSAVSGKDESRASSASSSGGVRSMIETGISWSSSTSTSRNVCDAFFAKLIDPEARERTNLTVTGSNTPGGSRTPPGDRARPGRDRSLPEQRASDVPPCRRAFPRSCHLPSRRPSVHWLRTAASLPSRTLLPQPNSGAQAASLSAAVVLLAPRGIGDNLVALRQQSRPALGSRLSSPPGGGSGCASLGMLRQRFPNSREDLPATIRSNRLPDRVPS